MVQRATRHRNVFAGLGLFVLAVASAGPGTGEASNPLAGGPRGATLKESEKPGAPAGPATESTRVAAAASRANWPSRITIGGAEPGTPFYGVATGWAKVLEGKLGIPTNVIAGGGSQANVQIVQSGEATFGLSSMNNVYEGVSGTRWAQGRKTDKVRAILPTLVQFLKCYALKESGIGRFKDFDGRVVSAGPAGTQLPVYVKEIFEAVGARPARTVNIPHGQGPDFLKDRKGAGVCHIGGAPLTAVAEANLTHPLAVVVPSDEERDQILKALPFFAKGSLSKAFYQAYKGLLDKDVPTLSVYVAFIGSKDLPEDFVYEVLRITYPNVPEIAKAHRAGSEIRLELAAHITSPFHRGAARYLQEQGVKLQESARPID
jgi:TRAP transporter TAXI family solute receptor